MNAKVAKCLLVSKVLVADGMMTDDERLFLETMMTALALDPEERQQLVEQLVDAASADGRLSANELATIKRVAVALDIPA